MHDRLLGQAPRGQSAKERGTLDRLAAAFATMVASLVFASLAWAIFCLLPTLLMDFLEEFGRHIVRIPRG